MGIPTMRRHATGQARVTLCGHDVYLGQWGLPETKRRYEETIAAWLGAGRAWPLRIAGELTIGALAAEYREHALATFRKSDRPTSHATRLVLVTRLLECAGFGPGRVVDFSPDDLREFRLYLLRDPARRWNRRTANEYAKMVIGMIAWCVSRQKLGPAREFVSIVQALRLVEPLRKGAVPAAGIAVPREPEPIRPAELGAVLATQTRMKPMHRAMVEVQLLTGMRPEELVSMRPADLGPTAVAGVRVYRVRAEGNKGDHRETRKMVVIGPKAWAALEPWLPADPELYVFRPSLHAGKARGSRAGRRRRREGPKPPDRFTTTSYGRAVRRACERARVPAWSPHKLRHAAATYITEREGLDVARMILGHTTLAMTANYVHAPDREAIDAALLHG